MITVSGIVASYDALVLRALVVARRLNEYIGEESYAKLAIDGKDARLYWPRPSVYYDSAEIEQNEFRFPASLLTAVEEEFVAWKKKRDEERERAEQEFYEQRRKHVELEERATYEKLKRKYGP